MFGQKTSPDPHQEIVDRHADLAELARDQAAEGKPVGGAERVVGGEGVQRAVLRDVLQAFHFNLDVHASERVVAELRAVVAAGENLVQPVLMDEALEEIDDETRELFPFEFGGQDLIQVDQAVLYTIIGVHIKTKLRKSC